MLGDLDLCKHSMQSIFDEFLNIKMCFSLITVKAVSGLLGLQLEDLLSKKGGGYTKSEMSGAPVHVRF